MSAEELRQAVPYLRNPFICNWDTAVAQALADWLERTANDFQQQVHADAPDCPNCGSGYCPGHPQANWCTRCDNAVESADYTDDPCHCWTQALATARALALSFGLTADDEAPSGTAPAALDSDTAAAGGSPVRWEDLKVGQVIDFLHHNRSQRLAGRAPQVCRGTIELIWYPADRATKNRLPQIKLAVMKKDGTRRPGKAGSHTLFDDYAIRSVVRIVEDPPPGPGCQDPGPVSSGG